MRILIVHNQLWAHYKSVLFQEIYKELTSQYTTSSLLVAQIALHEKSREGMVRKGEKMDYQYPYKVLFNRSLDSVGALERTVALFREYNAFKPDVVNITGYFDIAQVVLMFFAKANGKKVIISSESSEVDRKRSIPKEFLKKCILGAADAFFCFGSSTVAYLTSLGIAAEKIVVTKAAVVDNDEIANQFQAARNQLSSQTFRNFIFVGRLAPEKNLVTLLSAFKRCQESENRYPQWGLILVGEGPEKSSLEEFIHRNKIANVKFVGGVSWKEVPNWLAQGTVLVLPSFSEPWGLVVNEAMVCGMPVIVSNKCGCAPDLIEENGNGFLIEPTNVLSLTKAMGYYMDKPDAIQKHGDRSREIIREFSPKTVANEMVKAFSQLAELKVDENT